MILDDLEIRTTHGSADGVAELRGGAYDDQFSGARLAGGTNQFEDLGQVLPIGRLHEGGAGAQRHAAAQLILAADHVYGNLAGAGIVLEAVEDGPASHVGESDIEGDGDRPELGGE